MGASGDGSDSSAARAEPLDHLRHHGAADTMRIILEAHRAAGGEVRARRFLEYRRRWDAASAGAPQDHPLFVAFAPIDACNMRCVHCIRALPGGHASRGLLPLAEMERRLDECAAAGVESVGLGSFGEMLLHPDALGILRAAGRRGFLDTMCFTNGLLLDEAAVDALFEAEVTRLFVSIDAATAETYARVRGSDFGRVTRNVLAFLDRRAHAGRTLPILRVSFVRHNLNAHEADDFVRFWRPLAEDVDLQDLFDMRRVERLPDEDLRDPTATCRYPCAMLFVGWDGVVRPCCSEYNAHLPVGRASLAEAWRSSLMASLRTQFGPGLRPHRACVNCLNAVRAEAAFAPLAK